MLLPHLLSLAALTCSVAAKPVARAALYKRQVSDSSISGITQTSAEAIPSAPTEARPSCTSFFAGSKEHDCGDIAASYGIHLPRHVAIYPSTSHECKAILQDYGICCNESDKGYSTTHLRATTIPVYTGPIYNGTRPNMTAIANSTRPLVTQSVGVRERIVTRLETKTLSFTVGAAVASVRTVVITKTVTELVTFTTTITLGPSTPATSTGILVTAPTPITAPTSAASCSAVTPPPEAVTNAVVAGCTQWYTAIPGDFCYKIAVQFGVPVTIFMSWNPTINAPWCTNLQAGSAYCVATCENPGLGTPAPSVGGSLSSAASPTLPAGVTSLPASPTLPAGVTSLTPSPTLPAGVTSLPPSPTLPAGVTSEPSVPAVSPTSAAASAPASPSSSQQPLPSTPAGTGTNVYKSYLGDGSVAAGWPSTDQWVDFDYMFSQNEPQMLASCAQWGVPDDTPEEVADLKSSILSVGSSSNVDPRFILAIIMQESTGCVRVITTAYSHPNPGLMQSHNGTGTCNTNMAPLGLPGVPDTGIVQTPCPASEIQQMVQDGTAGTDQGDGLVQLLAQQGDAGAQGYYRTARMYNGGSIASSGLLQDGCCTSSYSSDVANRLTGWTTAPRSFNG